MPKHYRDQDTYETYGDVYSSVDGKTSKGGAPNAKLRDKARNKRAQTLKSNAATGKLEPIYVPWSRLLSKFTEQVCAKKMSSYII